MSKLILAVEDQEDNMQILRDLVTSAGYEIVEAENGEAALAAVKRFQAWLGHSVAIKSSRVIRRQLSEQARRA